MTAVAPPSRSDVVGTPISTTSYEELLGLLHAPPAGRARTVAFCNVHSVMSARRDPGLRAALTACDVATPDGVPLVWTLRLTGHPGQQRVYGPDFMELALAEGVARGWRHYLYGATEETLALLRGRIAERWPGADVVGVHAPPFRSQTPQEEEADLAAIRASGAGVVWVGLGMPKQERWIHRVADRLPGTTVLGVGAAFDFLAGTLDQAPDRLQRLGLEWAYRLAKEPRRLWRRYAVNNLLFVLAALRQLARARGWSR